MHIISHRKLWIPQFEDIGKLMRAIGIVQGACACHQHQCAQGHSCRSFDPLVQGQQGDDSSQEKGVQVA